MHFGQVENFLKKSKTWSSFLSTKGLNLRKVVIKNLVIFVPFDYESN